MGGYPECIAPLVTSGVSLEHAKALRRVAMTLHSWSELECGTDRGAIERDEKTGKPYWRYGDGSKQGPIPDREAGALARLKYIMLHYPQLGYYVQGDCRGAPLYILRPGDVPEGEDPDAYYNRGVAVYK